jgi:hypothetical protein
MHVGQSLGEDDAWPMRPKHGGDVAAAAMIAAVFDGVQVLKKNKCNCSIV